MLSASSQNVNYTLQVLWNKGYTDRLRLLTDRFVM